MGETTPARADAFGRLCQEHSDHPVFARGRSDRAQPAYRDRETGIALFNKRSGKAVHTDVARHVHLIANSGRQQEICAIKIWRERMSLDFPSLYLELIVLRALGSEHFGQLAENILAALHYFSNRLEQVVVA